LLNVEYRTIPTCGNCDNQAVHFHHVVPKVLGGTDRPGNLVPLCEACHGLVHDRNFLNHKALQMAGIRKAQRLGRYSKGKSIDYDLVLALKKQGLSKSKIARTAGISRMSVYRIFEWIDKYSTEEQEKKSWDIDLLGERIINGLED
jgi:hypothetical protein